MLKTDPLNSSNSPSLGESIYGSTLLEVIWTQRWLFCACVFGSLALASLYLLNATRIYRATGSVLLNPVASPLLGTAEPSRISENYNQTRADELRSLTVLNRAVSEGQLRQLKTFQEETGDLAQAIRHGTALQVDPAKRSDILNVTMDSAYPEDAVAVVNAVMVAYIAENARLSRTGGSEMEALLATERDTLAAHRRALQSELAELNKSTGLMPLAQGQGTTLTQRTFSLSNSLNTAETTLVDLESQYKALESAIKTPDSLTAFVEAQQFRGRDFGDAEYDDLRQQMSALQLALGQLEEVQGERHYRVVSIKNSIARLRARIKEKEASIARAYLQWLATEIASNKATVQKLTTLMGAHQDSASGLSPQLTRYEEIVNELARVEREFEVLDQRATQVRVNSIVAGPMSARVLEPAQMAKSPVSPKKGLSLIIAMLSGTLLGMGLSLLREWRDARLQNVEEIPHWLGASVLAIVPRMSREVSPLDRGRLIQIDPRSMAAEAYRNIRTMMTLGASQSIKSILITSSAAGDGKSTTTSNLAIAFAQSGERTLLIDADLRSPVQHLIFSTPGRAGLAGVLLGDAKLREAISSSGIEGLDILPCGQLPLNPAELLSGNRFQRVLGALSKTYDRVIIDSSPLGHTPDAALLAAAADSAILVVRLNQSARRHGMLAVSILRRVGANFTGIVANDATSRGASVHYDNSAQYSSHSARLLPLSRKSQIRPIDEDLELSDFANGGNGHI